MLRENLNGIRVIRAFNRSDFEQKRAQGAFDDYAQTAIRVNKIFAVLMPMILLVLNLSCVVIVAVGGQNVADGRMQIGDIMALIEYAVLILMYLIMGAMIFMIFPRAQSCANRVNAVLAVPTSETAVSAPIAFPERRHQGAPKLEFRHVTFQYQGAEKPVLSNISFTAETGKTTAIIGGTGSGKSTIASLIPRFLRYSKRNHPSGRQGYRPDPQAGAAGKNRFCAAKSIFVQRYHSRLYVISIKDASMEEIRHAAEDRPNR